MKSAAARAVTRREVLRAGLALASISGAIGLDAAFAATAGKDQLGLPKPGAIVLDEDLEMSAALVRFLQSRKPDLPLLALRLDSTTSTQLKPIFNSAPVIAGLSSGATLFCLERIAWDHGYRISRRSEHLLDSVTANAADNDATVARLADAIIDDEPALFATAIDPAGRAYRPSMTDRTLHSWILQMTATPRKSTVWPETK
jgi:hypothetical protein